MTLSDAEILALFEARREEAIRQCRKKYGKLILHIAGEITGSKEDAEECENDVYYKAWSSIPPERPQSLSAYLCALTRNTSLDRLKSQTREKRGGGRNCAALEELDECLEDRVLSVEDKYVLKDAVSRFVASLPDKDRVIFVQRYFYLLRIAQIAREQHLRSGAVKMRLLRIKEKFAEFLRDEGYKF